jgi:hypothetical protein
LALGIFDLLFDLSKYMRWDIFTHGLSVDQQQPDFSIGETIEVNDSHSATFATTCTSPTGLPYTSRPGDNIPSIWVSGDEGDKRVSIFIVPAVAGEAHEGRGFYDREHGLEYTATP